MHGDDRDIEALRHLAAHQTLADPAVADAWRIFARAIGHQGFARDSLFELIAALARADDFGVDELSFEVEPQAPDEVLVSFVADSARAPRLPFVCELERALAAAFELPQPPTGRARQVPPREDVAHTILCVVSRLVDLSPEALAGGDIGRYRARFSELERALGEVAERFCAKGFRARAKANAAADELGRTLRERGLPRVAASTVEAHEAGLSPAVAALLERAERPELLCVGSLLRLLTQLRAGLALRSPYLVTDAHARAWGAHFLAVTRPPHTSESLAVRAPAWRVAWPKTSG